MATNREIEEQRILDEQNAAVRADARVGENRIDDAAQPRLPGESLKDAAARVEAARVANRDPSRGDLTRYPLTNDPRGPYSNDPRDARDPRDRNRQGFRGRRLSRDELATRPEVHEMKRELDLAKDREAHANVPPFVPIVADATPLGKALAEALRLASMQLFSQPNVIAAIRRATLISEGKPVPWTPDETARELALLTDIARLGTPAERTAADAKIAEINGFDRLSTGDRLTAEARLRTLDGYGPYGTGYDYPETDAEDRANDGRTLLNTTEGDAAFNLRADAEANRRGRVANSGVNTDGRMSPADSRYPGGQDPRYPGGQINPATGQPFSTTDDGRRTDADRSASTDPRYSESNDPRFMSDAARLEADRVAGRKLPPR